MGFAVAVSHLIERAARFSTGPTEIFCNEHERRCLPPLPFNENK